MPLAFTNVSIQMVGLRKQVQGTVTFDNSYLTGGEPFTPQMIGLSAIDFAEAENPNADYRVLWNRDRNAPTFLVFQGDNANASAAPGTQVPNATNLSTLVANFTATGW